MASTKCLFAHWQRHAFRPALHDVGQNQSMNEAALGSLPAMRDQIDFPVPGKLFCPVRKGTDRNHFPHTVGRSGFLPSARGQFSDCVKLTIHGGSTHRQELRPHALFQLQMSVSLQRFHQQRRQGFQPFAANAVRVGGKLRYEEGEIAVPTGPGLGVELDRDKLKEYSERFKREGGYQYDRDPQRPEWYAVVPENRFAKPRTTNRK